MTNLAGHWLDSGRPVPGYVSDTLDRLTRVGLLTLGEEDPQYCGARRVTVTDAGSAQFVALPDPQPEPTGRGVHPRRWACSPPAQSPTRRTPPRSDRAPDRSLRPPHALVGRYQHPTHRAPVSGVRGARLIRSRNRHMIGQPFLDGRQRLRSRAGQRHVMACVGHDQRVERHIRAIEWTLGGDQRCGG